MNRLAVLTDSAAKNEAIRSQLSHGFELDFIGRAQMRDTKPPEDLLVDIDLRNEILFNEIWMWLKKRRNGRNLIFAVDRRSPIDSLRSADLGATDVIARPLNRDALFKALLGDFDSLMFDKSEPPLRNSPKVGPALDALGSIFAASRFGTPLKMPEIKNASEGIVEIIQDKGLENWLDVVRRHHSQTYQHLLIISGVTAAFCKRLGFSSKDQTKLCLGAMFHDVGKSHVPVSILEKPGALDAREMSLVRQHPELGFDCLRHAKDLGKDILEIVLHHHEYLDGSGYPGCLTAGDISDCVRIITICDIFSAMIEKRSYKPSMSAEQAFKALEDMGPKLDPVILRVFSFSSDLRLAA
jgi:putative nucleotidyltransferase with HDIG domain